MKKIIFFFLIQTSLILAIYSLKEEGDSNSQKLTGKTISSDTLSSSLDNAFNNDYSSEFKSSIKSHGWVGMELSSPSRITKIGWAQKSEDKDKYLLGVFEGANDSTFIDATPLYMITEETESNKMNYISIEVTEKFKYVRYLGPHNQYSVISGFEIYGSDNTSENNEKKYQPTNLPFLVINIEKSKELKKKGDQADCNIQLINDGKTSLKQEKVSIKVRGNSSSEVAKKSFGLKFTEPINILDFPAKAKKWVLLANQMDKTLLRNKLGLKISSLMKMTYTPECRSVDVVLNGEFKGNYILCDQVEVRKNRVGVTEMDKDCKEEPEISGGYLLVMDGGAYIEGEFQETKRKIMYTIKYPSEDDITNEQKNYITSYFNDLENDIYNGIIDKIDLETYTKLFLIDEFVGDIDCMWGSYYIYKERGDEKFYFGPAWDFDLSFDCDIRLYPTNEKKRFMYKCGGTAGTLRDFVIKLMGNEKVLDSVKSMWNEIIEKKIFDKEQLYNFIDEEKKKIEQSRKLNFIRWKILDKRVYLDAEPAGDYDDEVQRVKDFIEKRFDVLGEVINKADVNNVGHDIKVVPLPWNMGPFDGEDDQN